MATVKFILRTILFLLLALVFVSIFTTEVQTLKNDTTAADFEVLKQEISGVVDDEGKFHIENVPDGVNPVIEPSENGNYVIFSKGNVQLKFMFDPVDGHETGLFERSTREAEVKDAKRLIGASIAIFLLVILGEIASINLFIEERRKKSNK